VSERPLIVRWRGSLRGAGRVGAGEGSVEHSGE